MSDSITEYLRYLTQDLYSRLIAPMNQNRYPDVAKERIRLALSDAYERGLKDGKASMSVITRP